MGRLTKYITIGMFALLTGCSSIPSGTMAFGEYQEKIMMCEQMGMRVHVVNTIIRGVPYVKSVVCYDRHGASWNASQLRNGR